MLYACIHRRQKNLQVKAEGDIEATKSHSVRLPVVFDVKVFQMDAVLIPAVAGISIANRRWFGVNYLVSVEVKKVRWKVYYY